MSYFTESAKQNIMSFKAAAIFANKGVAVKVDSANGYPYVALATDGDTAIGVLAETAAAAGDAVKVYLSGPIVPVVANGAITIGDSVNSAAATGKVDTAGNAEHAIGYALAAATAQDDEIPVLLAPHVTAAS
jgi:predicted RecA/RadA family phage recombinase